MAALLASGCFSTSGSAPAASAVTQTGPASASSTGPASPESGDDPTGASTITSGADGPSTTTRSAEDADDADDGTSTGTDGCIQPPSGLVAWWPGDGSATDVVGGFHGEPAGDNPQGFVRGVRGQALAFNGIDESLIAPTTAGLNVAAGNFSVTMWARLETLIAPATSQSQEPEDLSLISQMGGSNSDGWRILKQQDGRFWFCFGDADGANNGCETGDTTLVRSQIEVEAGRWYHIAAVKDGLTITLYVDGTSQDSSEMRGYTATGASPIRLGAWQGNPGPGPVGDGLLAGSLDEVMILGRALTAEEILTLSEGAQLCPRR